MAFSTQRAVSDGTLQLLMVEIEFFDKSEITAYFDNIPTTAFVWATDKSLRFDLPVPTGIEVLLRRTTDLSQPRHIFSQGAQFKDSTLDEDFKQILHIAQEAVEGANVGDIYQPLNMHGNPILNVGPAVDDGSAVSLGQVKTESASAWVAANQATAALAGVQASANTATQQAGIATGAATSAGNSAATATTQAGIATTAVANIGTSVADAANSAAASQASRLASEAARDQSVTARDASIAAKNLAQTAAATADTAGLQLGMAVWGHRPQPFKGFALDDGQELDRATYPDFAAALDAGLLPVVSQALWNSVPANRACFVANSSTGKFRMRDLNGVSAGTVVPGGAFLRGGTGAAALRRDQLQNITGTFAGSTNATRFNPTAFLGAFSGTGAANADTGSASLNNQASTINFDASAVARTGTETAPNQATGAWMTRLYGLITPLGSAEASSLATAYASMSSRVGVLEALPRLRRWTSADLPTTGAIQSFTHTLGVKPDNINVSVVLTAALGGWPSGTVFESALGTDWVNNGYGLQLQNVTSSSFQMMGGAGGLIVLDNNGQAKGVTGFQCKVRLEFQAWV